MRRSSRPLLRSLGPLVGFALACSDGATGPQPVAVVDVSPTAITLASGQTTTLAGIPWELSLYSTTAQVNWTFERGGETVEVHGAIDSLSVTVPEPASAWLIAVGLTALGFRRARS